jgi:hypothetical protein
MAEIPVERKRNLAWLWIVLALLLIGALIWWATARDGREVATVPVDTEARLEPAAAPVAGAGAATIANILASPAAYVGRDDFSGEFDVPDVPTDRGFWVEDEGQRLFALIIDEPREVPKDINPGQRLRISQGMIRDRNFLSQMPGRQLKPDTQQIIQEQDAYLVVDEDNIEILSRG